MQTTHTTRLPQPPRRSIATGLTLALATAVGTAQTEVQGWGQHAFTWSDPTTYVQVVAGAYHSVGLRSDGSIIAWGRNGNGECSVPAERNFVEVATGSGVTLARRADGSISAWGANNFGQCNVPALPPGLTYPAIAAGYGHSVARRSDGAILAWGNNSSGQCNVPALPPGLTYVEVAAGGDHTLARRSDGVVLGFGKNDEGQCNVPALSPGLAYVEIAAGYLHSVARRSDGAVVAWGRNLDGQGNVPAPPAGLTYVEVACGAFHTLARRSDGTIVAVGWNLEGQVDVPAAPNGLSCVELDAGGHHSVARFGLPSTYTTFGFGCAGSRPAARLVPLDTPRLGRTLQVRLFDLPVNVAFLMTGWSSATSTFGALPLNLAFVGMPGCTGYVSVDAVELVIGSNHQAIYELPIPSHSGLVGMVFHHQALVPDPGAGNALGALESDAARAAIGR